MSLPIRFVVATFGVLIAAAGTLAVGARAVGARDTNRPKPTIGGTREPPVHEPQRPNAPRPSGGTCAGAPLTGSA
jgi:hypothetical protein